MSLSKCCCQCMLCNPVLFTSSLFLLFLLSHSLSLYLPVFRGHRLSPPLPPLSLHLPLSPSLSLSLSLSLSISLFLFPPPSLISHPLFSFLPPPLFQHRCCHPLIVLCASHPGAPLSSPQLSPTTSQTIQSRIIRWQAFSLTTCGYQFP